MSPAAATLPGPRLAPREQDAPLDDVAAGGEWESDPGMWLLVPWRDGLGADDLAALASGALPRSEDEIAVRAVAGAQPGDFIVPGGLSRPGGQAAAAFDAGAAAEDLPPGAALAGLTATAWAARHVASDDELIGIVRAFRRLAAWAQAGELAAVAELIARRNAQVAAGADAHLAEHVNDELAAALTLTSRGADQLADFAARLRDLPATMAALERGEIDRGKASIICDGVIGLSPGHAAAVEAAVIGAATRQTTGELRRSVRRAVLAADPEAADRRHEEARKEARVELWTEPSGTAGLAGRDLPAAEALAADQRITALARQLKKAGASGSMDALRARVYTALLLGIPANVLLGQAAGGTRSSLSDLTGSGAAFTGSGAPITGSGAALTGSGAALTGSGAPITGSGGPSAGSGGNEPSGDVPVGAGQDRTGGGACDGAGLAGAGVQLTGSINLTLPLTTLFGGSSPGQAAGFGPLPATDTRDLAALLAAQPATRWCLTLLGPDGNALAHGCANRGRAGTAGLTFTVQPLAVSDCQHQHESRGYQPGDLLRHLVAIRNPHCTYPGCARPAGQCDLDHTIPHDQGGRTCECNLAPRCRKHHHAKQTEHWHVDQPAPGHHSWSLPHGRTYHTGSGSYPADGP